MIYGHGGTIHGTRHLSIEVDPKGKVVSVWFRCCSLPFEVSEVNKERGAEMAKLSERVNKNTKLNAVDVEITGSQDA